MGGCLPDQPGSIREGKVSRSLKVSRLIKDYCFFVGIHPLVTKTNGKNGKATKEIFK